MAMDLKREMAAAQLMYRVGVGAAMLLRLWVNK